MPLRDSRDASERRLAYWCKTMRGLRRGKDYGGHKPLTSEQIDMLDGLGFVWEPRDRNWNDKFVS